MLPAILLSDWRIRVAIVRLHSATRLKFSILIADESQSLEEE